MSVVKVVIVIADTVCRKYFFTDTRLDFELSFSSTQVGYILSPGPVKSIQRLTATVWTKIVGPSTLLSYNTNGNAEQVLSFGVDANNKMFVKINGVVVTRY